MFIVQREFIIENKNYKSGEIITEDLVTERMLKLGIVKEEPNLELLLDDSSDVLSEFCDWTRQCL
jgi:hypothetical protein